MVTLVPEDEKTFRETLKAARRGPVRVSAPHEGGGVVMSDETFAVLRRELGGRLIELMRETRAKAAQSGFTEQDLKDLLPDYDEG